MTTELTSSPKPSYSEGIKNYSKWKHYAETGDKKIREELIESHLVLAGQLARRFANRGEAYEDLLQVGAVALISAVDRFNPEMGIEFGAFATATIIGELKRHLRDKGWAIRAPRRIQETYLELGHAVTEMTQRLGRTPTVAEISKEISVSEELLIEAMVAGQGYSAVLMSATDHDDSSPAATHGGVDPEFSKVEDRLLLEPAIASLPPREQEIMRMRFIDGLTQSEIATRIGVSQMHISRLINSSLASLRRTIGQGAER